MREVCPKSAFPKKGSSGSVSNLLVPGVIIEISSRKVINGRTLDLLAIRKPEMRHAT
jgi:hypothetical protein